MPLGGFRAKYAEALAREGDWLATQVGEVLVEDPRVEAWLLVAPLLDLGWAATMLGNGLSSCHSDSLLQVA